MSSAFCEIQELAYHLDLSEKSLDPNSCCAVAYVLMQSKERKISLDLEDIIVSEQGMRTLLGCLQNIQWYVSNYCLGYNVSYEVELSFCV